MKLELQILSPSFILCFWFLNISKLSTITKYSLVMFKVIKVFIYWSWTKHFNRLSDWINSHPKLMDHKPSSSNNANHLWYKRDVASLVVTPQAHQLLCHNSESIPHFWLRSSWNFITSDLRLQIWFLVTKNWSILINFKLLFLEISMLLFEQKLIFAHQ